MKLLSIGLIGLALTASSVTAMAAPANTSSSKMKVPVVAPGMSLKFFDGNRLIAESTSDKPVNYLKVHVGDVISVKQVTAYGDEEPVPCYGNEGPNSFRVPADIGEILIAGGDGSYDYLKCSYESN